VLRDLSQLQIHLRDYPGFEESRRKILMSKPNLMTNWVHLAGACYLNRNYMGSLNCIESIIKFSEEPSMRTKPNEISEIILLAIRNYECLGQYQEALDYYNANKHLVVDSVALQDYEGRLCF